MDRDGLSRYWLAFANQKVLYLEHLINNNQNIDALAR